MYQDAKLTTSSAVLSATVSALRAVLILSLLDPRTIGVWKAAMALYTFAEFSQLGISKGMGMLVPILRGQGKEDEARRRAQTAGDVSLLAGVASGLSIAVWSFFVEDADYRLALRFMAAVVLLAQPHQFLREYTAATKRFSLRAKETLFASLVDLAAYLSLATMFGLAGLGMATTLVVAFSVIYLTLGLRFRFGARIPVADAGLLMRRGLPISAATLTYDVARRLPLIVLALAADPVWVGYFGVSIMILDFASFTARLGIAHVVGPHLLQAYGKSGSLSSVVAYYETPARLFCYALPPVVAVGALFMPLFMKIVTPEYMPGAPAAQATLWSLIFITVHVSLEPFLIAAGKIPAQLRRLVTAVALGGAALGILLKTGAALATIAWTGVAVLALTAAAELYLARRSAGCGTRAALSFIAGLLFPVAAAIAIGAAVGVLDLSALPPLCRLPLRALLILLGYAPVLTAYERRYSLLRSVWRSSAAEREADDVAVSVSIPVCQGGAGGD